MIVETRVSRGGRAYGIVQPDPQPVSPWARRCAEGTLPADAHGALAYTPARVRNAATDLLDERAGYDDELAAFRDRSTAR